ncbi:hypothetical protein EHQ53_15095 [Leptospira langatensis]|uniref:Uncharacterized protein n=1 Tax=Leptospira langatensis TaxID=2484983 RepID=A0A5F1ZSC6_9LEPT|nr:hypothetical protein [Leptospira langatensis]TGK01800.1 hypothetical protein EHO57_08335 [Leptospira langatensis]TGL39407.1 hypothetical protein EHQ53_15095 [Leptospira langatensis]
MQKKDQGMSKQIFVAYSYRLYAKRDYRKIFSNLESIYKVRFIFADEKITNMHIMQKIISYIKGADYSIFDISGWNPNVTLELGFAMGASSNWYIALDPDKTEMKEVPSDLRGIDRIQYSSFSDFEDKLTILLEQLYPKRENSSIDSYLDSKREDLLKFLAGQTEGLNIKEIAQSMGVEQRVAQILISPLINNKIRTSGQRKGMKYHIVKRGPTKGTKYTKKQRTV